MTTRTVPGYPPSMTYGFEVDPCAVLGVAVGASLQELREAFDRKVIKHHPDRGGDDWAYGIVVRSYEILCTARVVGRALQDSSVAPMATAPSAFRMRAPGAIPKKTEWSSPGRRDEWAEPGKVVDVEVFLLRFDVAEVIDQFVGRDEDRNLSCCLNLAWSPAEDAPHPDQGETLAELTDAFNATEAKTQAVASWSSPEGGRFSGWLSYPSPKRAWDAFEVLHEELNGREVGVNQWTREMIIPRDLP